MRCAQPNGRVDAGGEGHAHLLCDVLNRPDYNVSGRCASASPAKPVGYARHEQGYGRQTRISPAFVLASNAVPSRVKAAETASMPRAVFTVVMSAPVFRSQSVRGV